VPKGKNMKKNTMKVLLLALFSLVLSPFAFAQQYTLGQTTLSSAVTASATQIQLASLTGINGYAPNLQPIPSSSTSPSFLYIDREQLQIIGSLPTVGTTVQVRRGVNGTAATAHASGQMVLSGPAVAWYTYDPGGAPNAPGAVSGVACTSTAVLVTPWVNVRSGAQWICSTISATWVPGFNNPAFISSGVPNTVVASGTAAMLPSGPLFHVSGTSAMTSVAIPVGCNATAVGGCSFIVIPDSTCSWTATNNIANAVTATAGNPILFVWDAVNSKFYLQTY
jgi:hypothetical protein